VISSWSPSRNSRSNGDYVSYTSIRRLGAGSFGEVWLESDDALGRQCATKYLNTARLTPDADVHAEAQAMVIAQHPNVVAVYSADEVRGAPVIRMEYLPNGSVEDKYHGAAVAVGDAIRLIEEACRGVEHLHACGLLHRDIKPANLMLDENGVAKVSDFGLSCQRGATEGVPPWSYMVHLPPEAVGTAGGITTPVGDVYGLGITAFRLLNGDSMFKQSFVSTAELLAAIAAGTYPVRNRWLPQIHPALRKTIRKALNVKPGERYHSAVDFRHALEKARPLVSWAQGDHAQSWDGVSPRNGTSWRAECLPSRGADRFTLERRLSGRRWRNVGSDSKVFASSSEALNYAEQVLGRLAATGS
jgi:serine/threonine protein kinase